MSAWNTTSCKSPRTDGDTAYTSLSHHLCVSASLYDQCTISLILNNNTRIKKITGGYFMSNCIALWLISFSTLAARSNTPCPSEAIAVPAPAPFPSSVAASAPAAGGPRVHYLEAKNSVIATTPLSSTPRSDHQLNYSFTVLVLQSRIKFFATTQSRFGSVVPSLPCAR